VRFPFGKSQVAELHLRKHREAPKVHARPRRARLRQAALFGETSNRDRDYKMPAEGTVSPHQRVEREKKKRERARARRAFPPAMRPRGNAFEER